MAGIKILNPDTPAELYVKEPVFYLPQGNEVTYLLTKFAAGRPVLLKGPTGSGKTTLFQYTSYLLGVGFNEIMKMKLPAQVMKQLETRTESFRKSGFPMFQIPCNEETTIEKIVGQPLFIDEETYWSMGYGSLAAKNGGMLYLDEPDRARPDALPAVNEMTDHRAQLTVLDLGITYRCPPSFWATGAFNPGYGQRKGKLTPDFRGRFGMFTLGYPTEKIEVDIIMHLTRIDRQTATRLRQVADATRKTAREEMTLQEGASPRQLIHAGEQIMLGLSFYDACMNEIAQPLTDNPEVLEGIEKHIRAFDGTRRKD